MLCSVFDPSFLEKSAAKGSHTLLCIVFLGSFPGTVVVRNPTEFDAFNGQPPAPVLAIMSCCVVVFCFVFLFFLIF